MADNNESTSTLEKLTADTVASIDARFLISLRWGDMDLYGHVNNVQYFRIFEEARARWMSQRQAPAFLDRGIVIASQSMEYKCPIQYSADSVLVDLSVDAPTRSSFTLNASISIRDEDGHATLHALARAVVVAFDANSESSRPWQDDEREWLLRQVRRQDHSSATTTVRS